MKKYPFVRQRGLSDCGPACILMILKYYGGYVSLDKLSDMLYTSNKGTTAYHMVDVLRSLGFNSDGYRHDNLSYIDCPCIALLNIHSYNHYVVIYKIDFEKSVLVIGDPSKGIIKMGFNEFLSYFDGVVISMTLKQKLVKEGEVNFFDFVFKLIRPNFKYLFLISIFSLVVSVLSVFSSFFVQVIITYLNSKLLFKIILSFALLFLVTIFISYMRNFVLIKLNHGIDRSLSMDAFNHIIHLPYKYAKNKTTGEILSYFNDLFLIKNIINYVAVSIFVDIPLAIILFILLYHISYQLFIINSFIFILYFILYLFFKRKNYFLTENVLREKALINSFITESVKGYETIRNLNLQDVRNKDFSDKYNNYLKVFDNFEKTKNYEFLFREVISNLSLILIIIYGVFSMKNGLSSESFVTVFLLSTLLNNVCKNLLDFNFEYEEVKNAINHIGELFIKDVTKKSVLAYGNISVNNLSYSFDGVNKVLDNISLDIKIGSKVLVSGKSGSGKSTLFKIIKGYYEDYDGTFLIDEFKGRENSFDNVLYVSSRETLFTGTIYDNLNINSINFENNNICELSKFIDNYNLIVEEDGFNISDGQRQRISLARSLSKFNILIIDEGLSQVDVSMERRILKKIFEKYNDKTIIFISHRLDNLDLFDRFLKLDKGHVVLDEVRNN